MPNILLKDKNGEDVEYRGVDKITLTTISQLGGELRSATFTYMNSLSSYFLIYDEKESKYKVTGKANISHLGWFSFIDIDEKQCRDYGKLFDITNENGGTDRLYSVLVLMTPKTLTVGNYYNMSELY